MTKVRILERDEQRVRFVLEDEQGNELAQRALPVAPLLEKARKQRKSLEYVLAREAGAQGVTEPAVEVSLVQDSDTFIGLEELYEHFSDKDHEHADIAEGRFAPFQHQHRGEIEAHQAIEALNEQLAGIQASLKAAERTLEHHDHEVVPHPHPSLQAEIGAVREAVTALEARPLPVVSLEGYVKAEQLAEAVNALRTAITSLGSYVDALENRLGARLEAIPTPKAGPSAEDVQAMIEAAKPKPGKQTFVLLSTQEVSGKQRWILEAADG